MNKFCSFYLLSFFFGHSFPCLLAVLPRKYQPYRLEIFTFLSPLREMVGGLLFYRGNYSLNPLSPMASPLLGPFFGGANPQFGNFKRPQSLPEKREFLFSEGEAKGWAGIFSPNGGWKKGKNSNRKRGKIFLRPTLLGESPQTKEKGAPKGNFPKGDPEKRDLKNQPQKKTPLFNRDHRGNWPPQRGKPTVGEKKF